MIFFQNSAKETGNLLFFKYRAKDASRFQVFTSSSYSTPNGNHQFYSTLELDGEWHLAIIQAKNITLDADGNYIAKHLRFDVEGTAGAWAEFAYVGYAEKLADIIAYVNEKDSAENIKAYCTCPGFAQESTDGGLVECPICGERDALELPYVGPKYKFVFDSIAGTATSGLNGYKVVSGGGVADPYKVNVSFSGWIVAEYGCKEYAYRIVVDGVPGEWVYFAGSGTYDSGVAGANKSSYPDWDWDNQTSGPAFNCRFWNEIMLDLATLHGKTVNIEIVAVNNLGAYMTMAIISDILPVHGGRGGYEYIDDETHGVKCAGCDEIWTVEKHTDAPQGEAEYVDKDTHKVLCACEGIDLISAHIGATSGAWNGTLYESNVACDACHEKYDYTATVVIEAESTNTIGGGVWSTSQKVSEDGTYKTISVNSAAGTWASSYFQINPQGVVSGQYLVIRYRIPVESGTRVLTIQTDTKEGEIAGSTAGYSGSVSVDLVVDNGWHVLVIDLAEVSQFKAAADGTYTASNASRLSFTTWDTGESIDIDWIRLYDRIEGIADEYCSCPAFAHVPAGEDTCAIVCSICGATIESFAAHDNTVLAYVQPDCINDGHTDGTECKNCGYQTYTVIPSTGAHAGGSDGEYCKGCKKFLKVDDVSSLFDALIGAGSTMKENSAAEHKSSWSDETGYIVYTKETGNGSNGVFTVSFSGETGRYFFIKYRTKGEITLQFYTSTEQAAAKHEYHGDVKVNSSEWQYAFIDLKSILIDKNGIVEADGGGYYIMSLRFDIEGDQGNCIEIAYMGIDNSYDDIVAGIKAIEGVTNVKTAYCPCGDILAGGIVYQDAQYHSQACKLCGTVTTMAHTNANVATWNADNSRYETTCTICNGLVVNPFQTTVNADFAGWGAAVNGGWHKYDSTTNGVRQFGPNSASGYGVSIQNPGTAGRYYILKYRVPAEAIQDGASVETATSVNIQIRFNGTGKVVTLKADDKWHVMLIDVATDWNLTVTNGRVTYTDYWFLMGSMYNSYKYFEVEYFGWTEFLDRIPADLVGTNDVCDCASHGMLCTYIDENTHSTKCAVCGKVASTEAHAAAVVTKAAVLPTCTTAGSSVEKACKCGVTMIESKTVPAQHMATGAITSVEDGKYYSTCDCGEKVEMYLDSIWDLDNLLDQSIKGFVTCDLVDGGVRYTNTTNGDAAIVSFENNNVPGRYFILKYRAGNLSKLDIFMSTEATTANGSYNAKPLVNSDGNWHILIVDGVKSAGFVANSDGTYTVHQLRIDVENDGGAAPWLEVAYWGFAHSADQIKNLLTADGDLDDYKTECTHVASTPLTVYELVGDGQGTEHYADCAVCGHEMTRGLSLGNFWGASYHWFTNPNGITNVVNNDDRIDGNLSCTSGIKEVKYVITNTGNAEETATVTTTPTYYSGVGGNASLNPEAFGDWESRKNTMHALVVPNWADVDGVDFSGDTVSITVYVVPNGDPTYSKAVVTFTITIAEDPAGAVES